MSETFQRLSQNFAPKDEVVGLALSTNARQLKSWVNDLPRGNPNETATILYSGLVNSLSEKLTGATRFNQLEEVRKVTVDCITWLERQFVGTTLPLVNERLAYAQTALNLHIALADSYRLATFEICSPHGSIPMLKSALVNSALASSLWHYQQSLFLSWKLYRTSITNVWLGMHRIYQFAKMVKLESKVTEDSLLAQSVSVHDLYCQTALVSLMNPYAFTQAEQLNLFKLAALFAPLCFVGVNKLTDQWAKLPIDSDLPVDCNLPDDQVIYLTFHELSKAVDVVEQDDGSETIEIVLVNDTRLTIPIKLLHKVKRTLGFTLARRFTREFARFPIESVIGLHAIHYFVAGRLDFDHFIQQLPRTQAQGLNSSSDWHSRNSDTAVQRTIAAEVLDHSLAGYRIKWENDILLRVRVGELLALNVMHPEPDWMVGVVRWLQYEDNGSVVAGVELMTRRCYAVALHIDQMLDSTTLVRGLELEPLEEEMPIQFLIAGRQPNQNQKVDVFYGFEPNRIGAARLSASFESNVTSLVSNMDYSLLVAQVQ